MNKHFVLWVTCCFFRMFFDCYRGLLSCKLSEIMEEQFHGLMYVLSKCICLFDK